MLLSTRKLRVSVKLNCRSAKKILYRSFIGMSFLAIICCGKKVQETDKSSGHQRYEAPVSTDLEQSLKDQQVSCEPGSVCPNYIGLVQFVDKGKVRSCTGFLFERDIVATASSCLPQMLRLANQDCSKDVYFHFASLGSAEKTFHVECQKVITASDLKTTNPIRWREDVAYLKMKEALPYRRTLNFSRKGMGDQENYTTWFIDKMDEKTSFIRKANCKNIHSSYINPFANNISSPNIIVSDCNLSENSSGAPLLDRKGEVRGMISTKMNSGLSDYLANSGLINKPLNKIYHGTSFACAPTIYDAHVLDENECLKDMSQVALDTEISKLLDPKEVFEDARKNLEKKLNSVSPYMNFTASLEGNNGERTLSFSPRCFKPYADWLSSVDNLNTVVSEFNFPEIIVKKSLDSYGRLMASIIEAKSQKYNIQFSVKNIKRYANSRVYFWSEGFNFNYPRITASCQ